MKLEVHKASNRQHMITLENITPYCSIKEVKEELSKKIKKFYVERQSLKAEPRGKSLEDDETLASHGLQTDGSKIYFKDLGPQVGWTTVFLTEYAGPLFIYPLFYLRPSFIYGEGASTTPIAEPVHLACACWCIHYAKRLLETVFVHRFSHGTMPIRNIFKNSMYYWGFTCLVSYFVNHPLYTPAKFGSIQIYGSLIGFLLCEYGNFVIHCLLRDLRPPGTKERRIPYPAKNPLSWMFKLVSCPNYTYEIGAWMFFTTMTQTLTAGLFCLAGFIQMAIWAKDKHRRYKKEFKDYPRRKAIVPFIL
ncbi:probable very-long-chain enoyl-CoA reductase art-1 [Rhopilema esculentum]|uniref:probable very-long-chain enoyl-CoA reductase art-1 n=1 Tax=Rhopilema esculentum TaxID=499914 RepID=UPI0031E1B587